MRISDWSSDVCSSDRHWRGFDEKPDEAAVAKGAKFWRKEERQGRLKSSRLDLLMYHYTTLRRVETLKVAHVFEEFKDWWDETPRDTGTELARLAVKIGRTSCRDRVCEYV